MRWAIGEDVIEILANRHRIDADQVGLRDLGRKEAYLTRQIKCWRRQWDESRTRDLPLMQGVATGSSRRRPSRVGWGIVHGDYRLRNMRGGATAGIEAVLDWELCTIGDPLADLGYVMNWVEHGDSPTSHGGSTLPTSARGFPDRQQVLARYAELTGRDVSRVDYYVPPSTGGSPRSPRVL